MWWGVILPHPPPAYWFSLNNWEMVKAMTLAFWAFSNISLSLTCPSLQILGKTSDFQISGQFLIKENSHNSRTSDDIDMKLGLVSKLDKRNKTTSIKFDDDVMSANCDVIVIFLIYDQFGVIQKLDSRHIVCKTYIFRNSNLLSYKN